MLGIIIGLLTLLVTLIGLRKDAIKDFFKETCKFLDDCYSSADFLRQRLNRKINSGDFLEWQDKMLEKIYCEYNKEYFTEILGKKYPVFCISLFQDFEFDEADSLCKNGNKYLLKGKEKDLPDIYSTKIMNEETAMDERGKKEEKALKRKLMGNDNYRKGYKWFTARSMPDGNHIGFILDELDVERDKIKKIHLSVGNYELNVLTSHILTYEFFKAYEELQREAKKLYDNEKERRDYLFDIPLYKLWPMLPFRRYIHRENKFVFKQVFFNGAGRYSLLSVQCLVMLCTSSEGQLEYKTFFGKRSENARKVSTKFGCYQFPPSGGFDLFEKDKFNYKVDRILEKNCSLTLALMREYLEELFDEDKCSKVDDTNNLESTATIENVNSDERTMDIKKLLKTDINDKRFKPKTRKAYFTTVGANVDLIDLRLSVNFLLVVNDYDYFSRNKDRFKFNNEIQSQEEGQELKMLLDWKSVDEKLKDKRNIVEDSVALYAQGKPAFREYLKKIVADESCIPEICNDY